MRPESAGRTRQQEGHMKKIESGAASRVLQNIFDQYGDIPPSVLIDVASDEDCEIHDRFTWDNDIAAHEHRLHQARKLIRTTRIVYEGRLQTLMHVPVVHEIGTGGRPGEGVYKPISAIVKTQSEYERTLAELVANVKGLNRSISLLTEAANREGVEPTVSADLMRLSKAASKVEGLIKTISLQ